MSNCFYISSEGHCASRWISNALTTNPNVISFHAIRSLPPIVVDERDSIPKNLKYLKLDKVSGYTESKAEELMWSLNQCTKHTDKSFGAVHTVWGLRAKAATERYGGKFGGIIRHPISQFHSIMNSYYIRHLSNFKLGLDPENYKYDYFDILRLDSKNIIKLVTFIKPELFLGRKISRAELKTRIYFKFKHIKNIFLQSKNFDESYFKRELSKVIQDTSLEYISYSLSQCVFEAIRRVLSDHRLFTENLNADKIINMEKATTDLSYFNNVQTTFTGHPLDSKYQDKLFELPHVNIHSRKKLSPEQIWVQWPNELKNLFEDIFFKNRNLLNYYESSNYWIPT